MIHFDEVSKHYPGGTVALDKVSFSVAPGEFIFVVRLKVRSLEP